VEDIPSKQLFGHLPEQTGKAGRLKSCLEMDFSIGNDFVNQKAHRKSEEEGNEIFQNKSKGRFHIEKKAETITLKKGDPRAEHHTHEEKDPCQKDH
jgi:hypothetical protein